MSDEDRVSEEEIVDDDGIEYDAEVEAPQDEQDESVEEEDEVVGNTNDAINANLNKIDDPDVLRGMVTRLRHENSNHRRAKNELSKENERLKSWKNSNLQKAKEADARAEKAESIAKQHIIKAAAAEYDVDEEFIDFIDGDTDEEIYYRASKLAGTRKRKPKSYENAPENPMFGGKRGNPLSPPRKAAGDDFIKELMGGSEPRRR